MTISKDRAKPSPMPDSWKHQGNLCYGNSSWQLSGTDDCSLLPGHERCLLFLCKLSSPFPSTSRDSRINEKSPWICELSQENLFKSYHKNNGGNKKLHQGFEIAYPTNFVFEYMNYIVIW